MATSTPDTSEIRRRGRQRLVGAVTIVLLLVVFVPMLLDPEPRKDGKEPAAVAIPSKDNAPALPVPSVAPVKTGAQPEPATVPPKPQLADATKSSTPPKAPEGPKVVAEPPKADLAQVIAAKEAAAASAPASAAAPAKPAAQPVAATAPKLEGFAVQVGAFRDDDKLRHAREKLAAAKITHFTEHLPNGDLTRLRAGPYKTREEADKAAAAIKTAGLDGKVVPLP